jgi:hypothetical protein
MPSLATIPVWLVALVLAGTAPWCVRAFAGALERSVRRRTQRVIASAEASTTEAARHGRVRAADVFEGDASSTASASASAGSTNASNEPAPRDADATS